MNEFDITSGYARSLAIQLHDVNPSTLLVIHCEPGSCTEHAAVCTTHDLNVVVTAQQKVALVRDTSVLSTFIFRN